MKDDSTLEDVCAAPATHRSAIGKRIALLLMLAVVAAAATGWLGVKAQTARASVSGYDLTLTYPRVARSGLDIPWELRLHHAGGFAGKIVVAVSADYFDIFEFQGMHPSPSDETATGKFVYLTFSPPAGDTFTVSLDTYVQPASQVGRHAVVAVTVDGQRAGRISYATWLIP
ncbi:MAG: hypothetical protein QOF18_202 [Frankiaceae bacterium]|nr:hypothetical protein [Frankiaceae bacterium]